MSTLSNVLRAEAVPFYPEFIVPLDQLIHRCCSVQPAPTGSSMHRAMDTVVSFQVDLVQFLG